METQTAITATQSTIDILGITGLVAGIVSVILAIVAIWQAMYFFSKGKDTESRTEAALVGIKSQVETLQSVNTKITDRLTKFVTTPRNDAAQASDLIAATLSSLPEIALKFLPPSQSANESTLRHEITLAYVALWHSVASTNVWASFSLPHPSEFDPEQPWHIWCKQVIDQSAADFKYMDNLVSQLDQNEIKSSQFQYAHLYNEVIQYLKPRIGDTSEHFSRMSKN